MEQQTEGMLIEVKESSCFLRYVKKISLAIGTMLFVVYYFFNLIQMQKMVKPTLINDEMTNVSIAYLLNQNYTIKTTHQQNQPKPTTISGHQVPAKLLRGAVVALEQAAKVHMSYIPNDFISSITSGILLCQLRIGSQVNIEYNNIQAAICAKQANRDKIMTQFRVGNSHFFLDSLIMTERVLVNSTKLCKLYHKIPYLYPKSDHAMDSKRYLTSLCDDVQNSTMGNEDAIAFLQRKYHQLFKQTTVSTNLISSNAMQQLKLSVRARSEYTVLETNVTKSKYHGGVFSYSFGKFQDFNVQWCFNGQDCSINNENWMKISEQLGLIATSTMARRMLNYSAYDRTSLDYFVITPAAFDPNFERDSMAVGQLLRSMNKTYSNFDPQFNHIPVVLKASSGSSSVYSHFGDLRCKALGYPIFTSEVENTGCFRIFKHFDRDMYMSIALSLITCFGNVSVFSILSLSSVLKESIRNVEKHVGCPKIIETLRKLDYSQYSSNSYLVNNRGKFEQIKEQNPVDDIETLSLGLMNNRAIALRYGTSPLLFNTTVGQNTTIKMVEEWILYSAIVRISFKIKGLHLPGLNRRLAVGLTKSGGVFFSQMSNSKVMLSNTLPSSFKSVVISSNLSEALATLLDYGIIISFIYLCIVIFNILTSLTNSITFIPQSIWQLGRVSLNLPGGKVFSFGMSILSIIGIRMIFNKMSFEEIVNSSNCHYELYRLFLFHLGTSWGLYNLDTLTENIIAIPNAIAGRAISWLYLMTWSICTAPLKTKGTLDFEGNIKGVSFNGVFVSSVISGSAITLDFISLICGWLFIKWIIQKLFRSAEMPRFGEEPEYVYTSILLNYVRVFRDEKNNNDRNFCKIQLSHLLGLTTLWLNKRSGFDFNIGKIVKWDNNLNKFRVNTLKEEKKTIIPAYTGLKCGVVDKGVVYILFWRTMKVLFLFYYVSVQIKLLLLVDDVFVNNELSELSLKHAMSREIQFIQEKQDIHTNKWYQRSTILSGSNIEAMLIDNNNEMTLSSYYQKRYSARLVLFIPVVIPCRLRLINKNRKNETFGSTFWQHLLCNDSNNNLESHETFFHQGNFSSALDSMILTQKLLGNSTEFCDLSWPRVSLLYNDATSAERNDSKLYIDKICDDVQMLTSDNISVKYDSMMKQITIPKYLLSSGYIFRMGYSMSEYYHQLKYSWKPHSQHFSFYRIGPGNWQFIRYHCLQNQKGCDIDGKVTQAFDAANIQMGLGRMEVITRSRKYASFDETPIAFWQEIPFVYLPHYYDDAKRVMAVVLDIQNTDRSFYLNINSKVVKAYLSSNYSKYAFAGTTKATCNSFTEPSINAHLSEVSDCKMETSSFSVLDDGAMTALRVLKCVCLRDANTTMNDALLDRLDVDYAVKQQLNTMDSKIYSNDCDDLLERVKALDWTVSPNMYIRQGNGTRLEDYQMAKYFNPVSEILAIQQNTISKDDLRKRVGGLVNINVNDALNVLLYVSLDRIRDKIHGILHPSSSRVVQAGVYRNGSIFYGTIPYKTISDRNIFTNNPTEIQVSQSLAEIVRLFLYLGLGLTFLYITILIVSIVARKCEIPAMVFGIGRVSLLMPGGLLVAISNGLYSVVAIRQLLANKSIYEMDFYELINLISAHLGTTWILYIIDNITGETVRFSPGVLYRISIWLYVFAWGICTLVFKKAEQITMFENLRPSTTDGKLSSTWRYTIQIEKFNKMDILFDISTMVAGWLILKLVIIYYLRNEIPSFNPLFERTYSSIICYRLYHSEIDSGRVYADGHGRILFHNSLTVGLTTMWYSRTKGFDLRTWKFIELQNQKLNPIVVKKITLPRSIGPPKLKNVAT